MAFLLQGFSVVSVCRCKSTTSPSNPTTILLSYSCDYQPLMARFRCSNSKGKPFNICWDSKAVSESKPMTKSDSNKDEICRRDLILHGFLGTAIFLFTAKSGPALDMDENVELSDYAIQVDEINAYSFSYPLKLPRRQVKLNWVESRKPERYSSAAPLSADARQRIVSERLDIKDNLIISVSIGPPNYRFLASKDKSKWEASDVAKSVLSDKSTTRLTTGQRVAESSVIDAHGHKIAGEPYWYYEYLAQKSPTTVDDRQLVYRHSLAVTAEREDIVAVINLKQLIIQRAKDDGAKDSTKMLHRNKEHIMNHCLSIKGYLYSLNVSTLSKSWNEMEPVLQKTISSFRLLPPTQNYVPPYKDPWKFW